MTSLGFLDSWVDWGFDDLPLLAVHLVLGLAAEAVDAAGEAGVASDAEECGSSLAGYVKGLVGLGTLPYLQNTITH